MKRSKRFLSLILVLLMAITSVTTSSILTVNAASKNPVFTINNVTGITNNNAKISAHITNPNKTKISRVGFQLGTASNKLTTNKYDNVNKAYNYVDANFQMSKYKVTLKANTTYYYRFYINTGNKNYYSSVKSFKTKPVTVKNPVFTINNVSGLTYNNAKISAHITNPNKTKISKVGFQLGTASNKLTTNKYDNVNKAYNYVDASFLMSKYKVTLKANTTYYYRMYITLGNKTYYSFVQSFKTLSYAKYTPIKSLPVSRIVQPSNDTKGSCYLSSIATLYGYKVGKYSGVDYRVGGKDVSQTSSALYKSFLKKNGGTWVHDSTVSYYGLKKQNYSLTSVYNLLKAGKPVVVYSGNHASIIVGYKGNSSTLNRSDFIIMEIKDGYIYNGKIYDKGYWDNSSSLYNSYANKPANSYFQSKSCYVSLDFWISANGTPTKMVTY